MREQIKTLPAVTVTIAAANILVWIFLEAAGSTYDSEFMTAWGGGVHSLYFGKWRVVEAIVLYIFTFRCGTFAK